MVRFLRGLDEQYSNVSSQIMLMKPLPDISEVFSLLTQQERQVNDSSIANLRAMVNLAESQTAGRGRGKGRSSGGQFQFGGRTSNEKGQSNKVCSRFVLTKLPLITIKIKKLEICPYKASIN